MNEHLKKDLELADAKAQYDANAKLLLSHKIILAHILVGAAPEFHGLSPDQVVPLIEGEPQVSHVSVNPGATNTEEPIKPMITGMNTESNVINEGTITYDIHFYVWSPDRTQKIKIIVDVEAQKSLPSQYDIVTRGIFYNARQISAQLDREFHIPHYNDMKKVYSIWLCMNVPGYLENTAIQYPICPSMLVGRVKDYGKYDLANVVVVNLSKAVADHSNMFHLHRFLETLLSPNMKVEEKAEILAEEYNIVMTQKMERSANLMCNLSEGIWEDGIKKGRQEGKQEGLKKGLKKGRKEGLEEGLKKGRLVQLCELIAMGTITTEQAAKSLDMTVDRFNSNLKSIQE